MGTSQEAYNILMDRALNTEQGIGGTIDRAKTSMLARQFKGMMKRKYSHGFSSI